MWCLWMGACPAGCLPKAVQLQDDRTEATRVAMERGILDIE